MAEFDLNLSTRPFPAYRLVNIALAILLVVLIVVSSWQAVGFLRNCAELFFSRYECREVKTIGINDRAPAIGYSHDSDIQMIRVL